MVAHQTGDPLKRQYRIERGDLDADHVGQGKESVQGLIVVRDPARRGIEIEGDDW